ncbi:hypothetical protein PC113_g21171 [Phytophthora cactorum]|uniref:Uncharacterized protein n=1 Tax=Phytophthora cactorum TaxID=29920 RepID=A0A8T0Y4Y6_9STRA|nr:hypothetical protein PC113_g21171 [Phytophthora cactorum]
MELIDNLRNAVLQQREHEVTNFFTNVNELREFISAREPAAGVNITVKMCCYNCEILSADTGSRITLVSWSAHAMFEEVREALNELNSVNRKPFIAQVTVWDSKKKVGSPKTGRLHFRVGAVYEFKQVHSVGYFSDIAKGSVQLEDGASDVDAANTESLLANDVPIVHINALHHVQQKRLHQKREIPEGTNHYTVKQRREALERVAVEGCKPTTQALNIPLGTLKGWQKKATLLFEYKGPRRAEQQRARATKQDHIWTRLGHLHEGWEEVI